MRLQFLIALVIASLFSVTPAQAQGQPVQEQIAVAEPAGSAVASGETPPAQLVVTFENGELTIKAHNVQLLEVLRRVCDQVGANFDGPSGASEPIFVDLGPGPIRQVLTSLLTGSLFNYAMQASEDDPNVLARIILSPMSDHPHTQDVTTVLEASAEEAPPPEVMVDPKEVMTQMKGLIAQAKGEIAGMGSDADPSLKESATQLFALLENSMDAVAAGTAQSQADNPPSPSAPQDDATPGRPPHHRHRR